MENKHAINNISLPRILFNHYTDANIEGEAFVSDHIFSYIVSGTHEIRIGGQLYSFKAGDYRFFRRNQLAAYVKKPSKEGFKSIAVHLDQGTLKEMSAENGGSSETNYVGADVLLLNPNQYFDYYINSLTPYLNTQGWIPEKIKQLKAKELVYILLQTNTLLKPALFDFNVPGKIDLEAFMNKHYRYNVGIDRFAFLTGRSVSGFKRDFEKQFNTTPGKWLVKKRLQEAYYLIEEKGKRPSDIYLDVGFNDLSHFSYAYKKEFGNAPTKRNGN
ncbi:MAG TPA: AraC family transcriptional regulator [Niastella sp.]